MCQETLVKRGDGVKPEKLSWLVEEPGHQNTKKGEIIKMLLKPISCQHCMFCRSSCILGKQRNIFAVDLCI